MTAKKNPPRKKIGLRVVDCCMTCSYWQGWPDNMFCDKHKIEVKPYLICNDHRKENES